MAAIENSGRALPAGEGAMSEKELPPLPEPDIWVREDFGLGDSTVHQGYTAAQMAAYGQACAQAAWREHMQAKKEHAAEQDAKDAARYRWLRDAESRSLVFVDPIDDDLCGDELDAAIDKARGEA